MSKPAMNALQVMDRYREEVIQVSTQKNDKKVQYLYDILMSFGVNHKCHCLITFLVESLY